MYIRIALQSPEKNFSVACTMRQPLLFLSYFLFLFVSTCTFGIDTPLVQKSTEGKRLTASFHASLGKKRHMTALPPSNPPFDWLCVMTAAHPHLTPHQKNSQLLSTIPTHTRIGKGGATLHTRRWHKVLAQRACNATGRVWAGLPPPTLVG
jgi:hypothetical protein